LIFSKLQGGYWPNVELVASKAHSIISADANGDDVAPYLASGSKPRSSSPKKSPVKKSVTPAQVPVQVQPVAQPEAPVKPFKLDESQKFLEPAVEAKEAAPVKVDSEERPEPTQEAPAAVEEKKPEPVVEEKQPEPVVEQPAANDEECDITTVNGKLVVTAKSAPTCVKKILDIKSKFPDNCMAQAFDEDYYNSLNDDQKIRLLTCCLSGVANPDSCMGCYAMNPKDYDEFSPFFKKALAQYHKVDLSVKSHKNNWSLQGVEGLPESGVLDLSELGLPELSMRVRTGRNLNKYPLPGAMTKEDRINMEKDMKKVYDALIADPNYGGKYVSITPGHENFIDEAEYNEYVKAHIMFKDMSVDSYLLAAGIAGDWPFGRGCYVSEDKGFIIWNGEEDHLRIMCMQKGHILNKVFDRLEQAVKVVE
jgi:hypothetical protein